MWRTAAVAEPSRSICTTRRQHEVLHPSRPLRLGSATAAVREQCQDAHFSQEVMRPAFLPSSCKVPPIFLL